MSGYPGLVVRKVGGVALAVLLGVAAALVPATARGAGVLSVEVMNGYNLVVDSNVTSPATYAPKSAYLGAKVCNTGDTALANVFAHVGDYDPATPAGSTPGVFPPASGAALPAWIAGTGAYALAIEAGETGISDGTRYIGTLAAGACRMEYWLFSYPQCVNVDPDADGTYERDDPPCAASVTGGIKPDDDVSLDYDVWATTTTAGVATTAVTRDFTLRNEISASANKIWPNTTSKVPDEYLAAIASVLGWGTLGPDGQPLTEGNPVYPGQRVITTQGIWYDLGNVGQGFDNNGDLLPDQNAWLQPVGDPGSFDADCFRMVNVYGVVIVKLKTGGELLIPFQNRLYFENIPENTGVVGLVYYQYIATDSGCSANLTPYQEAASGFDNEKFSADYGLALGLASGSYGAALSFTKSDGVTAVAPGGTLTYTLTAANTGTGVNLGAPDLGTPLVFRETIPAGTTYVAGSAAAGLGAPAGNGSYTQGYTDPDGNYDSCTIAYRFGSPASYVILYSADSGGTWSLAEPAPAGTVTDLQWLLITTLQLDGGHDGTDCIAPDGTFDDGTLETSLPAGKTASLSFQVTVNGAPPYPGPVLCNTAGIGYGPAAPGITAQDCDGVTGDNAVAGAVFRDNGTSGGIYGNGTQDGAETGIGAGVAVQLYYDLNGDGQHDAGDLLYATTATAANGTYGFSSVADGPYVVVVRKYDGAIADGIDNAATDAAFGTAGWGNTTYDPNLPLATDQGILKLGEDLNRVSLAVNVDYNRDSGAQTVAGVNFGFAPPLRLTKSVLGNPDLNVDGRADTAVDEGDLFSYTINLENRLPSVGRQGPTGCEYTVWAGVGATGSSPKDFTNPGNAWDATSPSGTVASAYVDGGGLRWLYGRSFALAPQLGSISKVEGLYFGYYSTTLTDDFLSLEGSFGVDNNGLATPKQTATLSTAMIDSYVGPRPDFDPSSAISWDISLLRPGCAAPCSVANWGWADFPNLYLLVNADKASKADAKYFHLDAIGVRVTSDRDCEADASTTLGPVPLQDTYDTGSFAFVSADPPPTAVDTAGGVIRWDDVGPILPGTTRTVTVTVRALNVTGTRTGVCGASAPPAADSACNWAETAWGGKSVHYADGRPANDASGRVAVTIQGKAELSGVAWKDTNNDGWPDNDGEPRLPDVPVSLYACLRSTGMLETGTSSTKDCAAMSQGNAWVRIAGTATGAGGAYEFIGLDPGYYLVEVGDTDAVPATGNASPYGGTQTAEPNDTQAAGGGNATGTAGVCAGGCNNTWGSPAANLRADQTTINFLGDTTAGSEEKVAGINFGYSIPNAVIHGNVWHDIDGDAAADPGEGALAGFTVRLYTDADGDGQIEPGDTVVAATVSDAGGNYLFSGLAAGSYVVAVTPPVLASKAWTETVETSGGTASLDNRIPVAVGPGAISGSHDFGYTLADTSDIGDTVWFDFDGDGVQDPAELGIPAVAVRLYLDVDRDGRIDDGVDTLLAADETDASGKYLFAGYPAGSYVVAVDTTDPDFPAGAAVTGDPDLNAASIGDRIWLDADGDGVQDAGEEGIPGVVLLLTRDEDGDGIRGAGEPVVAATITNAGGGYLFTGLGAGGYFVDVDEATLPSPLLAPTTADPAGTLVVLANRTIATQVLSADAGYSLAAGFALGSRVWSDADGDNVQDPGEVGIPGVTVTVTNGSGTGCSPSCTAVTDVDGSWLVTGAAGLTGGTFTVDVVNASLPRNFTLTAGTDPRTVTIAGADLMTVDLGYRYNTDGNVATEDAGDPTGAITGRIYSDVSGNAAWDAGVDIALGGTIVNLLDEAGAIVATTAAAADGTYAFTGVFIGNYSVQAVDEPGALTSVLFLSAGQTFPNLDVVYDAAVATVADAQAGVAVDGVHDDLNQDFGFQRFLGSIGDTVYQDVNENATQDLGEPGIQGVSVRLFLCGWGDANADGIYQSGEQLGCAGALATAVTSADDPLTAADEGGKYLFSNLATPSDARTIAAGTSAGSTIVTSAGLFLPGDAGTAIKGPGIPDGAYVTAYTDSSSVTISASATATGGAQLSAGQRYYLVAVDAATLPAAWTLIADPDTDGFPCTLIPDPDILGDEYAPPSVCDSRQLVPDFAPGINYLGADFGYRVTGAGHGTIGDHLWIDTDGDGAVDAGEPGIAHVTVYLDGGAPGFDWADGNGNGAWDAGEGDPWVETDSDGYYVFTSLADGAFTVRVLATDGDWPPTLPTAPTYEAGTAGSFDSSVPVTLAAGAATVGGSPCAVDCNLTVDFGYRYPGANTLAGTICTESGTLDGYCGDTATDYSGVGSGESPLAGVVVSLYRWTDGGDDSAWLGDGTLDAGDSFTFLGSATTDGAGDFAFANVPDGNVVAVFSVVDSQQLRLTTDHANSSVEGAAKLQLYEGTRLYGGNVVTVLARQALDLGGNTRDVDFAFDLSLGGALAYDFGDLPDTFTAGTPDTPDYDATLLVSNGARHLRGAVFLGAGVSTETDGFDSPLAEADADDGVTLLDTDWVAGPEGTGVAVDAPIGSWLAAWVDFNGDGDFTGPGELVINQAVAANPVDPLELPFFPIDVPAGIAGTDLVFFARFRVYPERPRFVSSAGAALDAGFQPTVGEVEDYRWNVNVTPAVIASFTGCDAGGAVALEWRTASARGTLGFVLRRWDEGRRTFVDAGGRLLPALIGAPQGIYRFLDAAASPDRSQAYELLEIEAMGRRTVHGPFMVDAAAAGACAGDPTAEYTREPVRAPEPASRALATGEGQGTSVLAGIAGETVKISTAAEAVHFVGAQEIAAALGIGVAEVRRALRADRYALSTGGRQVAFLPGAAGDGAWFFAQAQRSQFARESVYRLGPADTPALRMAIRDEDAAGAGTGEETFPRVAREERDLVPGHAIFSDAARDHWLWDFFVAGEPAKSYPVRADAVDPGAGEATLTVLLIGATDTEADPDHHALVRLNGTLIGEVRWNGLATVQATFAFDASLLADGENAVEIAAADDTAAPWSVFYLDSFTLRCRSRYRATGDRLAFAAAGNPAIRVTGFSTPDVMLFDVTRPKRPVLITARPFADGEGTWGIAIAPRSPGARYQALTVQAAAAAVRVAADRPSSLRSRLNRGRYLVVTTRELLGPARRLAQLRDGIAVDIEDVYDEFNHGVPSPHALRRFLSHARRFWRVRPHYVALAGDGTFDYRDNLGLGGNLIPPMLVGTGQGLFPSDSWFADVAGGPAPEMAIGRLPVSSAAELDLLVDKIVLRETAADRDWISRLLATADDPDRAGDFPAGSDRIAALAPPGVAVTSIRLDPAAPAAARAALLAGIRDGVGLVSYVGHAGFTALAEEELLRVEDVETLGNDTTPTVLTAMTCLAGDFAFPGYPGLAEALVRRATGGAAAAWAPTGLSVNDHAVRLAERFYAAAFGGDEVRIGDAVLAAQRAYERDRGTATMLRVYVLLGDPALRLR